MKLFSWQTHQTWISDDQRVGLAQLGIGILNTEPQPVISADGNLVLLMCGEFYNAAHVRSQLKNLRDVASPTITQAELALYAFETWGQECARYLEGPFFIAVYEKREQRLTLLNDRFGLYPHYYCLHDGGLIFAPQVKGVLCAFSIPRKLDVTALAEYMRFQQLLGDKTFHEGIFRFPYGSSGVFDLRAGTWTLRRYWDWDQIPDNSHITFDEAVSATGHLFEQAVHKLSADTEKPGVFLSGGLDSRAIAGMMARHTSSFVTATFGTRECRDVYYAERIAAAVGSRHLWFDLPEDGHWVKDNADLHLKLTEGFHSWIHMHGITMLPVLRGVIDFNLSGWDGGTVMGHIDHINPIFNNPVDFPTILAENFKRFNQVYTWPGLTEAEERLLYQPAFGKKVWGLAFESMREELKRFWQFKRDYAAEYFYIVNHCWRHTGNMIVFTRGFVEARFPFWDYALIDFLYSLRPEIRRDQLMFRHIITRWMPRLALIPYDKNEHLPTVRPLVHNLQALTVRTRRRLRLMSRRSTLYADYENYLRRGLRDWAEGILYSTSFAERGIFDPDYVRSLMTRHLDGREMWTIGKIAPLITFEMMMREYFD